jgi:phage tail-like protein
LVPGLPTPHPIGEGLPGIYLEDDFVQRLCSAVDEVLAPVFCTLESLPSYLDPDHAPLDMLAWLAGWIGLTVHDGQPPELRRRLVRAGARLMPWRGTARGVRDAVAVVYGATPEVEESGAAQWASAPGEPLPGGAPARLIVRLSVTDPGDVDMLRLDALVAAVKPAHVPHRVEVRQTR